MSQKQKQSDEEITRKAILAGDGGILPDGRTVREARLEFLASQTEVKSLESQESQESPEKESPEKESPEKESPDKEGKEEK